MLITVAFFLGSIEVANADDTWLRIQGISGSWIVNLTCTASNDGRTTCSVTDCGSGRQVPMKNIKTLTEGHFFSGELNRTTYYFKTMNPLYRTKCFPELLPFWNSVSRNFK